jgi:hypothetical protein
MDAKQIEDEEASVVDRDHGGVKVSRRRFARAGLSGSVVLGSLASKPVLGAVPYHCTVSGQVSGNLSRAALAGECVLGQCTQFWIDGDWPSGFVKGTQPSENCAFVGNVSPSVPRARGTSFNGFTTGAGVPALIPAFFNVATGSGSSQACSVTLTLTTNLRLYSTMLQVLSTTDLDEKFELGRVVVTSLLNVALLGNSYPVTTHSIIAMFNATFGGGNFFPVDGSQAVTWNRTRVIEYLSSLYSSSCAL